MVAVLAAWTATAVSRGPAVAVASRVTCSVLDCWSDEEAKNLDEDDAFVAARLASPSVSGEVSLVSVNGTPREAIQR